MGIAKKTDGRYVVGVGVENANDYKGSAAYRDIYIQLTSSGATAKSEEYLTFLKDYGFHANASGEPIMPPSVNVWISNNGVTTAVEADDVSIDGSNYTICGIKWNGSTWDYSDAGQGKSGSGLPSYTSSDIGKVLTVGEKTRTVVVVPEQTVTTDENGNATIIGVDFSELPNGQTVALYADGTPTNVTYDAEAGGLTYRGNVIVSQSTLTYTPNTTLTVKALSEVPATSISYVVPEQTVTINSETTMPGVIVSSDNTLQVGASCDVIIDTNSYPAVAEASGSSVLVRVQIDATHQAVFRLNNGDIYFVYMEEAGGVYMIKPGTYTISLIVSAPSAEPKWETSVEVFNAQFDGASATESSVPLLLFDLNNNAVDAATLSGMCYITANENEEYSSLNAILAVVDGTGMGFGAWGSGANALLRLRRGTLTVSLPQ